MMVTTGARDASVSGVVGVVEQAFLDVGFGDALDGMAEFFGDQLRRVGVDHVVDRRHVALLHQHADDIDAALGHAVGEFLDRDGLGNDHFARSSFSFGSSAACPLRRWVRRRNDATERSRTSSAWRR